MFYGLFAGVTWGIETVILGIALSKSVFVDTSTAVIGAMLVSSFLHDFTMGIWTLIYSVFKGSFKETIKITKTKTGGNIAITAIITSIVATVGYNLCINELGSSIGSAVSAMAPAIGAVLAFFFMKEKLSVSKWCFLLISIVGVVMLSYSPGETVNNFFLGALGALAYSVGSGMESIILGKLVQQEVPDECLLTIRHFSESIINGLIFVNLFGGFGLLKEIIISNPEGVLFVICAASLFACVSFILYYKAIVKIGVSKTIVLNATYVVWAMLLTAIISKDFSVFTNPFTILGALLTLVFGILTAIDIKELFSKQ